MGHFVVSRRIMPFLFENCQSVKIKGLTIIGIFRLPFWEKLLDIIQKRVREIKPFQDGFAESREGQ